MNKPLLGRSLKAETNLICDLELEGHNKIIPKGKVAVQVTGDETIIAQGLYHSRMCYEAAREHYLKLKKETEQENG